MKKVLAILVVFVLALGILTYYSLGAPGKNSQLQTVVLSSNTNDAVALELQQDGYVKSFTLFSFLLNIKNPSGNITPGGYYLSSNMDAISVIDHLKKGPDLVEVLIREGLRKEQVGQILAGALNWGSQQKDQWNHLHENDDYFEGVYFPDTYLMPVHATADEAAQRMIANFNEKFAPLADKFEAKNEKWTTGLKLASIIQREAAGSSDMPLISGILWNRLLANQPLQVDATVQYALGRPDDWWPALNSTDTADTKSSYNTYLHSGLPPTPISEPGLAAIKAALNPKDTDCLYYLHKDRVIHCSKTYEEHLENIKKYLQ